MRPYIIGDIHGRSDLLDRAIAVIHRDVAEQGLAALTLMLGDYTDRGLDSHGVLDRLIDNQFATLGDPPVYISASERTLR